MTNNNRRSHWCTKLIAALLPLLALGQANATTIDCVGAELSAVVCSSQRTVVNDDFAIFRFDVTTPGEYEISLTDLMWPSGTLSSLSLLLTTSTSTVAELPSSGSMMFFASAGTYFAQVSAVATTMDPIGLYSIRVENLAPIPLPSTVLLLISGFVTVVYTVRRRERVASENTEFVPAIA